MLIQRAHRGRTATCPKCGAGLEVPQSLDFVSIENATRRDREHAALLVAWAMFAGLSCCLPGSALVWWSSDGAIRRARDDGRPVDPLLVSTRAVAVVWAATAMLAWLAVVAFSTLSS
jgi:hypothetical protein